MAHVVQSTRQGQVDRIPAPSGFLGITLTSSNLALSKQFYTEVLCGELLEDGRDIVRVRFGDFTVTATTQSGGITPPESEFPHIAFTVTREAFSGLIERMKAYGVATHEPWTRPGKPYALMYFRDPSGNQFELFSPEGSDLPLRFGGRRGGDYVLPLATLTYQDLTPPADGGARLPWTPPTGLNHISAAVRDLQEGKRFLVEVLQGEVVHDEPIHVTAMIGGCPYAIAPSDGGWTPADQENPRYTFLVEPRELLPLKQRIESYGVPVHDIATRDGDDAFMYFRCPSGNMLELLCPHGFEGTTRRLRSAGGTYEIDVRALCYDRWNDPAKLS